MHLNVGCGTHIVHSYIAPNPRSNRNSVVGLIFLFMVLDFPNHLLYSTNAMQGQMPICWIFGPADVFTFYTWLPCQMSTLNCEASFALHLHPPPNC